MAKLKKSEDPQPLVISRLKVVAALQSCGNAAAVNDLDYSCALDLYSYDTAGKYTEWENSVPANPTKAFHLVNTSKKEVVLLPLDNCVVKDVHLIEGGITDSAFLTNEELLFVEFKTNATSSTNDALKRNSKKARKQLWHTYESILKPKFAAQGIIIDDEVDVEFYIVFDSSLVVTAASASFMNQMTQFQNEHGHPLFFTNEREL